MTTTMNRLPVSTWNPLGVNYAPASAALPAVPAAGWAKAEALSPALPAGVTTPAAADFGSFAASGMGAETDAWLAANANLVNHLAVTGTADAPVMFETALDADHPHALTYLTIDAAAGSSAASATGARPLSQQQISAIALAAATANSVRHSPLFSAGSCVSHSGSTQPVPAV